MQYLISQLKHSAKHIHPIHIDFMTIFDCVHTKRSKVISFCWCLWPLTSLNWYLFKQSNQNNTDAMKTYNTLDKLCNDVSYASLSWLLTILKRFSDTAFSNREYGPLHPMLSCETDQIYSRADCEKSNDRIYSTTVPNTIL